MKQYHKIHILLFGSYAEIKKTEAIIYDITALCITLERLDVYGSLA